MVALTPTSKHSCQDLDGIVERHGLACLAAVPRPDGDPGDGASGAPPAPAPDALGGSGVGEQSALAARLEAAVAGAAVALVLGSEGRGLSAGARGRCRAVGVPMPGAMESLNVGQAGAVLMAALSPGLPALLRQLYGLL